MNLLDLSLLIIILGYLLNWSRRSAAYHSTMIMLSLAGYYVALVISVLVANSLLEESLYKAIATVAIIATTLAVTTFFGSRLAQKLRVRIMSSSFYWLDRALALPVKIVGALAILFVVTQTFAYIPLTQLQFMSQGSTVFITADRFMPDTAYRTTAKQIDPDQFSTLILQSDPRPVSTAQLEQSEQFGNLPFEAADSIVRVTGAKYAGMSTGMGSGFSVGDGLYATAAHVVIGLSAIYIKPVGGGAYPATPLIIDQQRDVAILRSTYLTLPPLPLYSGRLSEETPALALGFPGAGGLTMIEAGIAAPDESPISSESSELTAQNTYLYDAPDIKPGSSGSGVLNQDGEVLGIAVAVSQIREYRGSFGYKIVSSGEAIVVDSNVVQDALDRAETAFRSEGTGLGRTFAGY